MCSIDKIYSKSHVSSSVQSFQSQHEVIKSKIQSITNRLNSINNKNEKQKIDIKLQQVRQQKHQKVNQIKEELFQLKYFNDQKAKSEQMKQIIKKQRQDNFLKLRESFYLINSKVQGKRDIIKQQHSLNEKLINYNQQKYKDKTKEIIEQYRQHQILKKQNLEAIRQQKQINAINLKQMKQKIIQQEIQQDQIQLDQLYQKQFQLQTIDLVTQDQLNQINYQK